MDSNTLKIHPRLGNEIEEQISKVKSSDSAVDGIEILVEMAQSGKIDPWNIDIVEVTSQYLQKLMEIKENKLKLTGRTLFFAALLLRLKSDVLEGINSLDEEVLEDNFLDELDDVDDDINNINYTNVISLDQVLQRRRSVRLHRGRVVTLDDLIKQLEFYEKIDKKLAFKNQQRKNSQKTRSYEKFTAEDIVNMAHDEYIDTSIQKIQAVLATLFETDDKIEMSRLQSPGMDKVSVYIALLFLAAETKIDLVQDEFYSDIYVVMEDEKDGKTEEEKQ